LKSPKNEYYMGEKIKVNEKEKALKIRKLQSKIMKLQEQIRELMRKP